MKSIEKPYELIRAAWLDEETIFWENLSSFEVKEGKLNVINLSTDQVAMHKTLNNHFGRALQYVGADKHDRFFIIENFAE